MTPVNATFYDGQTSRGIPVAIHVGSENQFLITGLERDLTYTLSEVRIASRVGNTPRRVFLPGGAICETLENDAIDAIVRQSGRAKWQGLVHVMESKWRYALVALLVTVVSGWGLIEYGIPALAERVAHAFPASTNRALGRDGLTLLDHGIFSSSTLEKERQLQLRTMFQTMTRQLPDGDTYHLELRKGERVGPNAFALPSGIIVITDELVLLTRHQNELIAVLAHEIGHVQHRHALRTLLQNSAVALLLASVTGDITSLTALSAALPTVLLEAKYSRAFEMEADRFALGYLHENNIQPSHFADILSRLEEAPGRKSEVHNYLASHPVTSQRIHMIRQ
jgi:Zn-dependent protease with chaperone function